MTDMEGSDFAADYVAEARLKAEGLLAEDEHLVPDLMFMYATEIRGREIGMFKHKVTRQYICLDAEGTPYRVDGRLRHETAEPMELAAAYDELVNPPEPERTPVVFNWDHLAEKGAN